MWSYSETAIEPSPYQTIILNFSTTTCKSYFLVKLQVWIIPVRNEVVSRTIRCLCDFTQTSYRRWNDSLCLSEGMQLYKTINSVKSIFLGFWAMVQTSYHVKTILEYTYFVFCILYNAFQRMLVVNTNKKNIGSRGF